MLVIVLYLAYFIVLTLRLSVLYYGVYTVYVCVCVSALTYLSNRGHRCVYTFTNRGPEGQEGTFFRSQLGHVLSQVNFMSKTLW